MRLIARTCVVLATLVLATPVFSQFNPGPNPIDTTQTAGRTLSSGTGTITATGAISTTGSTVPLVMTGTSTLINNGTIQTAGSGRAIDSNSGTANLTITNNGVISAVSTDAIRVNTAASSVLLNNSGIIRVTNGGQAIDWAAITTGSNVLNNLLTGRITSVGEDAVRPGANGFVSNLGVIAAEVTVNGSGAAAGGDGIDLRTFSGIQIDNHGDVSGRHGIATDGANVGPFNVSITNRNGGLIIGENGSGINIDGINSSVVANITNDVGGLILGSVRSDTAAGDGDGVDVDGVVNLTNMGYIQGLGARGAGNGAEGIAAGGGTIINNTNAFISGIEGGELGAAANGILIDDSSGGSAVAATNIYNDGSITGGNGFGIRMIGNFSDSISNDTHGHIGALGGSSTIDMGGGNDLLVNLGLITRNSGAPGELAVDLGAGNDQMFIAGDFAQVQGDISGGDGNDELQFQAESGVFMFAGSLINFEHVEVESGTVTLSGESTYTGETVVSGGVLELNGANRINTASRLVLGDAELRLVDAGGANGQGFSSLLLLGDAGIDVGLSSITFELLETVVSGSSLAVTGWSNATSADYALRFAGDLTGSAMFLALVENTTVNGFQALFSFDGAYTNLSAPVPLPAAAWLLASGLLGIAALRRKRGTLPIS